MKKHTAPCTESVSDIVGELRERAWKFTRDPEQAKLIEEYADRIEAAAERDIAAAWNEAYDEAIMKG